MFRDLKSNNRGVVFVTVLIIIIISMVLAVSVLSLNISQVKSSEEELKHIQAKLLSEGILAQMLVSQFTVAPVNSLSYTESIGNTTFTIQADIDQSGVPSPGSNSAPMTIDVSF